MREIYNITIAYARKEISEINSLNFTLSKQKDEQKSKLLHLFVPQRQHHQIKNSICAVHSELSDLLAVTTATGAHNVTEYQDQPKII